MVLCDTNIFISAFNGRQDTIDQLDKIGLDEIVLSAVTVMELFQGMGNKEELARMKKKIKYYDVVQMDAPPLARGCQKRTTKNQIKRGCWRDIHLVPTFGRVQTRHIQNNRVEPEG